MLSDKSGEFIIAQCPGEDLRSTGGILIHEEHDRIAEVMDEAGISLCYFFVAIAELHLHNELAIHESGKHFSRRFQKSTGVVAKIDYQTFEGMLLQLCELGIELLGSGLGERSDGHVSDSGLIQIF